MSYEAPQDWMLRQKYVEQGWSMRRIALVYGVGPTVVKRWLAEAGIERRPPKRVEAPQAYRDVERYEEVQYGEAWDGRALTKTVAILTCGHKVPMPEHSMRRSRVRMCAACTHKQEEETDGRP